MRDLQQALEDLAVSDGARRGRVWLRVSGLIGAFVLSLAGGIAAWGGRMSILALFGLLALLLAIVLTAFGLWRLSARRRTSRAPPPLDLE